MPYKRIIISKIREEIEKDKSSIKNEFAGQNGFIGYCGGCGFHIPEDKKYITMLWQKTGIDGKKFKETGGKKENGNYIINYGILCPRCTAHTTVQFTSLKTAVPYIERIGLYNH